MRGQLASFARWLLLLVLASLLMPAAAQSLESVLRPGDLIRGHAKWDEDCTQCHVRFDRAMPRTSAAWTAIRTSAPTCAHDRLPRPLKPQACRACHTDHKGRDARIVELDTKRFDHAQTDYALRGKHQQRRVRQVPSGRRKYSQAPQDCRLPPQGRHAQGQRWAASAPTATPRPTGRRPASTTTRPASR
jgi:hypothetical protein